MTNKEYYSNNLQITIQDKFSLIYYRENNIMKLLKYFIGGDHWNNINQWLQEEYNDFSYMTYKEE